MAARKELSQVPNNKEWVPAFAESTPRIEKKCSGGNDGQNGCFASSSRVNVRTIDKETHFWYTVNINAHGGGFR
jgi:hypothetical protein